MVVHAKKRLFLLMLIAGIVLIGGCAKQEESRQPTPEKPVSTVPLGISILPKGEPSEWTDEGFTEAFQRAREGGIDIAIWRHQWGDIEILPGDFKWGDVDYEVYKTEQQGLRYSLVIEVIHSNTLGRFPQGVSFTSFDDPDFVDAFRSFIRELLSRYPGKIHYLWIGNEVDWYLHQNKDQIEPFLSFYQQIEQEIKSIDPNITVGIVGAYHLARNNDEIELLQSLAEEGDAFGLTLYMEDDNGNPEVSETRNYFDRMFSYFPKKRIAIIETAWSSRGLKGSEEKQAAYVKEIARVIDKYKDSFEFFSWFVLYDFPEDINREIAASFGVSDDTEAGRRFLDWQGSLGLLYSNGTEKLAWQAWKEFVAGGKG
jgi:hypothetical protein